MNKRSIAIALFLFAAVFTNQAVIAASTALSMKEVIELISGKTVHGTS